MSPLCLCSSAGRLPRANRANTYAGQDIARLLCLVESRPPPSASSRIAVLTSLSVQFLTRAACVAFLLSASSLTCQSPEQQAKIDKLVARLQLLEDELAQQAGPVDPTPPTGPATRLQWFRQHESMRDDSPHKGMPWHFLGPDNVSGRITDVAVPTPRGRSYTIYAATATGGVWRTDNEGVTWSPIFEQQVTTSIGDLALDPSDPETLWVGTCSVVIYSFGCLYFVFVFHTKDS